MAAGSGAHLHGFIEWVDPKLSACSDAAFSTHRLGRCRMYDAENHGFRWRPRARKGRRAARNNRGAMSTREVVEAVVVTARHRRPALRHGSELKCPPNRVSAPAADLCRRRGEKRRCGIKFSCFGMRECTTVDPVRRTVSPLRQLDA